MGKIIVVASGKGGVGKTVAVSNIAVALAKMGKRVLMADLDIGLRNLDLAVGIHDVIVYDIMDVLEEKCSVEKAVFTLKGYGGVDILPAAQTIGKDSLEPQKFKKMFHRLRERYDYIIIDSPAGMEKGFQSAVASADCALIVVNPEMTSVRDSDRILSLLEAANMREMRLVINRARPKMMRRGDMLSVDEILNLLQIPLIGIVEEDETVLKSLKRNLLPVNDSSSKAGKEFRNIAKRILGENIPITKLSGSSRCFFRRRCR